LAIPAPERGLVICYVYLWHSEYLRGREEGVKDRPYVIVLAIEENDGVSMVTVAPVTHSEPANPDEAIEIPLSTKGRLGLDSARSWVIVNEVKRFAWPGSDLRPATAEPFNYGLFPPALFQRIQARFGSCFAGKRLVIFRRTE
jgi:mRNA-degrading endonuclease toxin of MazEF toxin-antitoxin module